MVERQAVKRRRVAYTTGGKWAQVQASRRNAAYWNYISETARTYLENKIKLKTLNLTREDIADLHSTIMAKAVERLSKSRDTIQNAKPEDIPVLIENSGIRKYLLKRVENTVNGFLNEREKREMAEKVFAEETKAEAGECGLTEEEKQELEHKIHALLSEEENPASLTPRELRILRVINGFEGKTKTMEEIGREYAITRERVRQIKERALGKIKSHLAKSTS